MDFPYDNSLVFLHESCIKGNTCVEIQLCGDTEIDIVAEYSTEEKAVKAMEMLREAYNNNEFYHCTATTNTFQETIGLLSSEKFKEVTSEYFRFPQDDEIEV
jgi:hypothetical protein